LIHGQVATGYIGRSSAGKIIVIDDKTAGNEFARDVLELATPPGIELDVYSSEQAVENWKADQFGSGSAFVIFKGIPTAYDTFKAGFEFESLMIGGTGIGPGRKNIEGPISLDERETKMLDEMAEHGVSIIFQQTAQTRITPWKDIRKKLEF